MKATLILMALLVAGVRADDLDDYMGAVYSRGGGYERVGSTYSGNDVITKCGSFFISSRGVAVKTGSVYTTEDNRIVSNVGSSFVSSTDVVTRVGNVYSGGNSFSFTAGSFIDKGVYLNASE